MTLLAIESAIDDVARVGQRSGELAVEIGVVLDHEEAQSIVLRLAAGMKLTIHGVNSRADHFATAAEQSQHIDEFVVVPAELGADDFRVLAVFSQRFDGLRQRNRMVGSDRGTLFGLGEAGTAVWRRRQPRLARLGRQVEGRQRQDGKPA